MDNIKNARCKEVNLMHAKEIKATPPEKIILQVEPISVRIEQAAEMMGTSEIRSASGSGKRGSRTS